jgi:hypothetical protein
MNCLGCGVFGCDAHHLRVDFDKKGMGLRPGDEWAVPLCRTCHMKLHKFGDERTWWDLKGISPKEVALDLWKESRGS